MGADARLSANSCRDTRFQQTFPRQVSYLQSITHITSYPCMLPRVTTCYHSTAHQSTNPGINRIYYNLGNPQEMYHEMRRFCEIDCNDLHRAYLRVCSDRTHFVQPIGTILRFRTSDWFLLSHELRGWSWDARVRKYIFRSNLLRCSKPLISGLTSLRHGLRCWN